MNKKFKYVSLLVLLVLVCVPLAAALADNVTNTLDSSIDSTYEIMPLVAGGSIGVTSFYVFPQNNDGKSGCNLTGSTILEVWVSSSDVNIATVYPASLTFTACGQANAVSLSVTPLNQGEATISLSQKYTNATGTFTFNTATFKVNVAPPPNTPPTIQITGVLGGESYPKGSVPAATCVVTDAEDGNSSFPATLSEISGIYASDGIGQQTASCSYTDAGGLTAVASVTYSIFDPTIPEISYVLDPVAPDGANGWYKSAVTLTWIVSEPESPNSLVTTGCEDQNITADQPETTYSCSATSAGGDAEPVEVSIKRDATPPLVSLIGGPAAGGSYYFHEVPAAPTCEASDNLSGLVEPCAVSGYGKLPGSYTVTASATDNAGNSASISAAYTVLPYTFNGFFAPVDMGGVFNVVKGGSTAPMKFEIFAGPLELTDVAFVQSFLATPIACDPTAPLEIIETTTTGGTSLRYDFVEGQFINNWQTPKKPGFCYKATITTIDGSTLEALFKLK